MTKICESGMTIPTTNKPTKVIRKTATANDHILAKSFVDSFSKSTTSIAWHPNGKRNFWSVKEKHLNCTYGWI